MEENEADEKVAPIHSHSQFKVTKKGQGTEGASKCADHISFFSDLGYKMMDLKSALSM